MELFGNFFNFRQDKKLSFDENFFDDCDPSKHFR